MIHLTNQFRVTLPIDDTWTLLTDLPRVARCLPGANLDEVVDGEYRGGMSTKIGPITAKYRGAASFLEEDALAHRAVISARGREEKGNGAASATITAFLTADGDGTLVNVTTDVDISGRAAQFGRSLLAEVSSTMMAEFARRLEGMIQGDEHHPPTGASNKTNKPNSQPDSPALTPAAHEANELNVAQTVLLPMLRKAAVPIAAAALACLTGLLIGRQGRRHSPHLRGAGAYVLVPAHAQDSSPLLLHHLRPLGD